MELDVLYKNFVGRFAGNGECFERRIDGLTLRIVDRNFKAGILAHILVCGNNAEPVGYNAVARNKCVARLFVGVGVGERHAVAFKGKRGLRVGRYYFYYRFDIFVSLGCIVRRNFDVVFNVGFEVADFIGNSDIEVQVVAYLQFLFEGDAFSVGLALVEYKVAALYIRNIAAGDVEVTHVAFAERRVGVQSVIDERTGVGSIRIFGMRHRQGFVFVGNIAGRGDFRSGRFRRVRVFFLQLDGKRLGRRVVSLIARTVQNRIRAHAVEFRAVRVFGVHFAIIVEVEVKAVFGAERRVRFVRTLVARNVLARRIVVVR